MSKTIGVIGLGSIGARHARSLRDLGCEVWGYDPDPAKAQGLGIYPIADPLHHAYDTIRMADGVVIANPTHNHYRVLLESMAYKRPTFVEKPLVATDNEWRDLHNYLSTKALVVGYNQRFNSAVRHAKAWLDTGAIGTPTWATFSCAQHNEKPDYLRDGVILNWSHEIDLALYLLGPAKVHDAIIDKDKRESCADILLIHDNAVVTHIHLDYVTKPERRGFAIGGAGGWLSASLPDRKTSLYGADGREEHFCDGVGSYDQDYKDEMQAFLDRIDGKETIGATGEEGLAVLRVCLDAKMKAMLG